MKKNGFTLIEMMVVAAIIAILATIGGVSLQGSFERNARSEFIVKVPMLLREYSDKAYVEGRHYQISITTGTRDITVLRIGAATTTMQSLTLPGALNYSVYTSANTIETVTAGALHTATSGAFAIDIDETGNVDWHMEIVARDRNTNAVANVSIRNIPFVRTAKVELFLPNSSNISGWNDTPVRGK